ncbi:putative receptor-like protein kinase At2g23200 [Bidens hawaiensis]|uniref:putative receptor-like protein kinase At2g23200 n=1 Tax=Bidens hawaiensis TaxID=980011 RepID=UPI0040497227
MHRFIPLREIKRATDNFNKAHFVGSGGHADVYKAKLDFLDTEGSPSTEGKSKDEMSKISKTVAIKRIKGVDEQAKQGFLTEIALLSSCKHPNVVSLIGFCKEAGEMILVNEFAFKGSLADYLISSDTVVLTWTQRIQICLDIANGINYLHTNMEGKPRIIHRDIKSDNILFDENMNAKLADFGLSKSHPMNQQPSSIYSRNIAGTTLYMDPEYLATGKYKKESDMYSFGVVLFEILSGKVAYDSVYINENDLGLAPIARRRFNEETLKELIDPK